MKFYGNEICCCSYACLNAIQDESMDVQLFEISTSTPFGIRHDENEYFDRLLTTYYDPNCGVDEALRLWGYRVEKMELKQAKDVISWLKQNLYGNRVVIGPIDMGSLGYQIMPELLKRMDHYITLEYGMGNEVVCMDSEGYYELAISYVDLEKWLNVEGVTEARNGISIRYFQKEKIPTESKIIEYSYRKAFQNLRKADEAGEGANSFLKCFHYLGQHEVYKWYLPFLYDVEYLLQRKNLFIALLDRCRELRIGECDRIEESRKILQAQIGVLGNIYIRLKYDRVIEKKEFEKAADLEKRLVWSSYR